MPWERKQLLGGKLKDATINHWEKVYECDVQDTSHRVQEDKHHPTPISAEKIHQQQCVQNGS